MRHDPFICVIIQAQEIPYRVWIPMGCLKLRFSLRKRATNYRALLRKMTYKDKASYDSTPPWSIAWRAAGTTHSYVTWLIHCGRVIRDMTRPYVTWLIHICHMTHSYTSRDSLVYVTWLIHMWYDSVIYDMPHSYMSHDSSIYDMTRPCVTWLVHMWHNSFVHVTRLNHMLHDLYKYDCRISSLS